MSIVDLDLVQLRATVRGWTHRRFVEDGIDCVSVLCKFGGILVLGDTGILNRVHPWGSAAHACIEAILTAPRWTLDRLFSEPPEGWRVAPVHDDEDGIVVLDWGGSQEEPEIRAAFGFVDGVPLATIDPAKSGRPAHLAERHRAAMGLAYLLAEIQP